jgi:hypothetical protein
MRMHTCPSSVKICRHAADYLCQEPTLYVYLARFLPFPLHARCAVHHTCVTRVVVAISAHSAQPYVGSLGYRLVLCRGASLHACEETPTVRTRPATGKYKDPCSSRPLVQHLHVARDHLPRKELRSCDTSASVLSAFCLKTRRLQLLTGGRAARSAVCCSKCETQPRTLCRHCGGQRDALIQLSHI